MSATQPSHLSTFTLSALALGSLSSDERTSADSHLAGCSRCRDLAAEMQAERERFTRGGVFERTLPPIRARVSTPFWSPAFWLKLGHLAWLVPTGAVAVALLALLTVGPGLERNRFAMKGGATLQVFAKRGIEIFAVHEGDTLKPGDQLRFAVEPADFGHLLIASLDGAGHVSLYYPFDGQESGTVTPDSRSELPGSVTLDATIGDEQLFAVFSKGSLTAKGILDQVHDQGAAFLEHPPNGSDTLTVRFHKAAP